MPSSGSDVVPQVATTTTTTVPCAPGWSRVSVGAGRLCASSPDAPLRVAVFPASGSLKVYWQGSINGGQLDYKGFKSDLALREYTVKWREVGTSSWNDVSPSVNATTTTTSTTTTSVAVSSSTTTTAASSGGIYTQNITGLTDEKVYEVRVWAENIVGHETPSGTVRRMPDTRDPGGWQPYDLPASEEAFLNEKLRRGEVLSICTTVLDFEDLITDAVNHWNNTLTLQGSVFQNVFEFSGNASSLSDCREVAQGSKAAKIDPNNSFDIIISDYRCPAGSTDSDGNACPANTRNCHPAGGCSPITRCTAANRDPNLACAGTATKCQATAAGCTWPNFSNWSGEKQGWVPRPVDGSAIQIMSVHDRLFKHELGHLLGLDDYGYECAREEWVSLPGSGPPRRGEYKVPSLYSYEDGPRSWQALIDDPSKYNSDYFNCRSDNAVTARDKKDLSAIYYPRAFTGNGFDFQLVNFEQIWRFEVIIPPSDADPSVTAENGSFDACDAGLGRSYVYNAHGWIIMHRAKGSSGAWEALRKDTAGTTDLSDGSVVFFRTSDLTGVVLASHDSAQKPTKLFEMHGPPLETGVGRAVSPDDCNYLAVHVNLLEPAYANIRNHEFVVVGVTRGDPLVNATNLDGTSRSNVLLDLGDGLKQWTLGEPSAVMTFPLAS